MNFVFKKTKKASEPEVQISQDTMRVYLTAEFQALGDVSQNGQITLCGFVRLLMLLGYPEVETGAEAIWKSLGKGDDDSMSLEEYIDLMSNSAIASGTSSWRKLFAQFDKDGNGYASQEEILQGLKNCGIEITPEVNETVTEMDENPLDDKISYAEFLKTQLNQ